MADSQEAQSFWHLATSRKISYSALKIALIVGTILAAINYGDKLLLGTMLTSDFIKLAVTYAVPYSVSVFSAVKAIQNHDK